MRYNNVEFRQSEMPDSHGYKTSEDRPSEIIAWVYIEDYDKEGTLYLLITPTHQFIKLYYFPKQQRQNYNINLEISMIKLNLIPQRSS